MSRMQPLKREIHWQKAATEEEEEIPLMEQDQATQGRNHQFCPLLILLQYSITSRGDASVEEMEKST